MRFFSTVAAVAALAFACTADAQQDNKPLPFDGSIKGLTVDTVTTKYMTHILTMRANNGTAKASDNLKIDPKGRSPAYNGDTGVATLMVDNSTIFKEQWNFRRSELVQFVAGNPTGSTFFRGSLRAEEVIQNKYTWQVFFPETHEFDVNIDFTVSPPKFLFLADNFQRQYETEFKYKTWTNFGFDLDGKTGLISFYWSEGDAPLKKVFTTTKALAADKIPSSYELHFGMLLYSETNNPPMVANHKDALQFSGVSVDKVGPSGASSAGGDADGDDDDSDSGSAPATTTAAPSAAATTKPSNCKTSKRRQ